MNKLIKILGILMIVSCMAACVAQTGQGVISESEFESKGEEPSSSLISESSKKPERENRRTIQKIARIGYRPYDRSTPPEQSLASYQMAYEKGYEILLCDVRTTADGYFVALHDASINRYAYDSDGNSLENEPEILLSELLLEMVDTYDFGVYKGEQYAGTKIMRVSELMDFCRERQLCIHLELKETLSDEKLEELVGLIHRYNLQDNIMINGQNAENMQELASALPNAIVGTWVLEINDAMIEQIASYSEHNPKFIYVSNGGEQSITPENYSKCLQHGIDIGYTEIRSEEELETFCSSGLLNYCKYVATRYDLYE